MDKESFFTSLQAHLDDALPWVAYRKPNEGTVKAFLQEDATLYTTEDFTESGFVFAPFNRDQKETVLIPSEVSQTIDFEDTATGAQDSIASAEGEPVVLDFDPKSKQKHIDLVTTGIQEIKSGVLKKVVLSRKQKATYTEDSPLTIFKRLLHQYSTAFVYCWYHPKVGLWLGATPETLLSLHHRKLKTMALAGTQRYLGTIDVTWGSKELEEQQLVTDSIVQNLSPILENIHVNAAHTHKAGSLLHLKTNIEADFDKTDGYLSKIITALHPTPAVCGLPQEKAKEFIIENENYNRRYYTGFLGELNVSKERSRSSHRRNVENLAYRMVAKYTDLFVNLRCMEIDASGAQLYVGGGVTGNSDAEAEWEETVNKLQTVGRVL